MATNLDLQEQEQLDALKSFWKRWGNPITWLLIAVLAAIAGYNGWTWYQRDQGVKAGAMFDELDRAVGAGDAEKATRVLADLRARFPRAAYTVQGALLTARVQFDQGQADAARESLRWAAEQTTEPELATVAAIRLAGMLLDAGQPDEALRVLALAKAGGFEPLVADRRGDILLAQGKAEEARGAYQLAWAGLADRVDYRQVVEAKLTALGAPPAPAVAATPGTAAGTAGTAPAPTPGASR
jgi:predicted negative regulator of RcsB-dependent stress response